MKTDEEYWDSFGRTKLFVQNPYFRYKKKELLRIVNKWWGPSPNGKLLKTDSFQEAYCFDALEFPNTKVIGIDVSSDVVKDARKRFPKEKFMVADIRNLPFKDNTFDYILSNSTLDHFPDINEALEEIYRVLKPGCGAIVTIINKQNPTLTILNGLLRITASDSRDADFAYSMNEMKARVEDVGFIVEDTDVILHLPAVIPTIINAVYRSPKMRLLRPLFDMVTFYCEKVGNHNSGLKYFTGQLLSLKCKKPLN